MYIFLFCLNMCNRCEKPAYSPHWGTRHQAGDQVSKSISPPHHDTVIAAITVLENVRAVTLGKVRPSVPQKLEAWVKQP